MGIQRTCLSGRDLQNTEAMRARYWWRLVVHWKPRLEGQRDIDRLRASDVDIAVGIARRQENAGWVRRTERRSVCSGQEWSCSVKSLNPFSNQNPLSHADHGCCCPRPRRRH